MPCTWASTSQEEVTVDEDITTEDTTDIRARMARKRVRRVRTDPLHLRPREYTSFWERMTRMGSMSHTLSFLSSKNWFLPEMTWNGEKEPDGSSLRKTWKKEVIDGRNHTWPRYHFTHCLS